MDLFLLNGKLLTFEGAFSDRGGESATVETPIEIEPVMHNEKTADLSHFLRRMLSVGPWKLKLVLKFDYEGGTTDKPFGHATLDLLDMSPCLLQRLDSIFEQTTPFVGPPQHFKLIVSVDNMKIGGKGPAVKLFPTVVSINLMGQGLIEYIPLRAGFLKELVTALTNSDGSYGRADFTVVGNFTIKLSLDETIFEGIMQPYLGVTRRLFQRKMFSDVAVVGKEGEPIPAHKAILAGASAVFLEMLEAMDPKSEQPVLKLDLLSKWGAQAFLAYIYCSEVKAAFKSFSITFELLQAGKKYQIGKLEDAMTHLILVRDHTWFTVEEAVRLLQFALDHPELYSLKEHAIHVLKMYAKLDPEELADSAEYQLFCGRNPDVAKKVGVTVPEAP